MQNLSLFFTNSDFDREYVRKEKMIHKIGKKDKQSRTIPPAFDETSPVNIGPLSRK